MIWTNSKKTPFYVAALVNVGSVMLATSSIAGGGSAPSIVGRNPNGFILRVENMKFVDGAWTGDANFTISACPQQSCFHLSGQIKIASAPQSEVTDYEGFFAVPRSACVIQFQEVPHDGMDSGDYRLTLVSNGKFLESCGALPAGLAGVYRQEG